MEDVQKHSVHTLVFRSLKRSADMFINEAMNPIQSDDKADKLRLAVKRRAEYGMVHDASEIRQVQVPGGYLSEKRPAPKLAITSGEAGKSDAQDTKNKPTDRALLEVQAGGHKMLVPKKAHTMPKPSWHPPWKLVRVISGHGGWVRCITVDPSNQFFVTGSGDRVIKIWDLASGTLKLSLTGHVSQVRGVAVSARHPYLFSCSEDKTVKCWDLEQNKVIRHYHGHLSAVYSVDIHPTIDVLFTCGRDAVCRVWDMRTKAPIHTLTGHTNTVTEVKSQAVDPQVITASHDSTVRLWDLAAGKTMATLTNHKKSVRALTLHPTQFTFASASPDNIKMWRFPEGNFIQNLSGHNAIVNSLAVNADGVLVSAGDNGSLNFWDWRSGYNFQRWTAPAQPGSIDSENGIFQICFDRSGSRLLTAEADKTIKIYKEDETATEESHPISWRPDILRKKKY